MLFHGPAQIRSPMSLWFCFSTLRSFSILPFWFISFFRTVLFLKKINLLNEQFMEITCCQPESCLNGLIWYRYSMHTYFVQFIFVSFHFYSSASLKFVFTLHCALSFHKSSLTCFVRLCIYDPRTRSFIFFIIFIPSSRKSLFFQKKIRLLNEQLIAYAVVVHTPVTVALFDFVPSNKPTTMEKLIGTEKNTRQATASKQVLMFFKLILLFSGDTAFCWRIFLEIMNNL